MIGMRFRKMLLRENARPSEREARKPRLCCVQPFFKTIFLQSDPSAKYEAATTTTNNPSVGFRTVYYSSRSRIGHVAARYCFAPVRPPPT